MRYGGTVDHEPRPTNTKHKTITNKNTIMKQKQLQVLESFFDHIVYNARHILLFLRDFYPACHYMCSGPFGVQGISNMTSTWFSVLPFFCTIFLLSSRTVNNFISSSFTPLLPSLTFTEHQSISGVSPDLPPSPPSHLQELIITKNNDNSLILSPIIRILTITSPLFCGLVFESATVISSILKRCLFLCKGRSPCDSSIELFISDLLEHDRLIRKPQYDMYFPPAPPPLPLSVAYDKKKGKRRKRKINGLVLFPGFLVDHSSYAKIAHALSNKGVAVVVLSLEPFRVPLFSSVSSANNRYKQSAGDNLSCSSHNNDMIFLIRDIQKEANKYMKQNDHDDDSICINWSIGGHSAGGYDAMKMLSAYKSATRTNDDGASVPKIRFSNLILWGSGTYPEYLTNLSIVPATSEHPFHTLVITASEDRFAQFTQHTKREFEAKIIGDRESKRRSKVKNYIIYKRIKGGNHSGFANYVSTDHLINGKRLISLESQQRLLCDMTVKFLKQHSNCLMESI